MIKFMWAMLIVGIILFFIGIIGSGCSDITLTTPEASAKSLELNKSELVEAHKVATISYKHAYSSTFIAEAAESAISTYNLRVVDIEKDPFHVWTIFVYGPTHRVDEWLDEQIENGGIIQ